MAANIILKSNQIWIANSFAKKYLPGKTVEGWAASVDIIREVIEGEVYTLYESISKQSRKKLPSLQTIKKIYKNTIEGDKEASIFQVLDEAKNIDYVNHLKEYQQYSDIKPAHVSEAAKLHAVFICLLKMQDDGCKDLLNKHKAFCSLYPGKYSAKEAFSKALKDAREKGLFFVCINKKWFGNNQRAKKADTIPEDYVTAMLTASPQMLSCTQMMAKGNEYFREQGMKEKKLTWYKMQRRAWLKNVEVYKSRRGAIELNKLMPYATMKKPDYANTVWQMDGVRVPFWGEKFASYDLVFVIDTNSKKIVGSAFGEKENTAVIMEALRDAVKNTGVLPLELITDKHSANKTNELTNVKELLAEKGAKWRVTSNAQEKAFVERYIQYLNGIWKTCYGFNGIGIRARIADAQPKDELKAEYAKNFLSVDTIQAYAYLAVHQFNETLLKTGKTPNQQYEESQHPHPLFVNEMERARLLTMQTEKKVLNGQITIMRGITKYEFPLPARWFEVYNNTIVLVQYDCLQDGIYAFDRKTKEPIAYLPLKDSIRSAQSEQTEDDIKALQRNAGRIKGIKTQAKNRLEDLTERAHRTDPDVYARVSALTESKDVIKELKRDSSLRYMLEDNGTNIEQIHIPGNTNNSLTSALKPKEKKQKEPFTPKNHTIEIINPLKQFDND